MAKEKQQEIRKVSMRVSGGSLPKGWSIVLNVDLDFTGCTRDELIDWAIGERRVACQRWLRNKDPEFLEKLQQDGFRLHAREAGSQVKSREDKIKELTALGIEQELAEKLVDSPEMMNNMIKKSEEQ